MPWYKVSFSWDDVGAVRAAELQDAFAALYTGMGGPRDVAMFASADVHDNIDFFSPRATELAKRLISKYGGVECQAPARSAVHLLVGSELGVEAMSFSPESDKEGEDDR